VLHSCIQDLTKALSGYEEEKPVSSQASVDTLGCGSEIKQIIQQL